MSESDNENNNEVESEIEEVESEAVDSETVDSEAVDSEEVVEMQDDAEDVSDVEPGGFSQSSANVNLETLLKVPVNLSIEVGRTQMALNEVLDTREGTVIELERRLDQPLDILVNGSLVAHGVVVLANDRFGIQITDIVSLQERAQNL